MVSTLDFESKDPSSSLGRTSFGAIVLPKCNLSSVRAGSLSRTSIVTPSLSYFDYKVDLSYFDYEVDLQDTIAPSFKWTTGLIDPLS